MIFDPELEWDEPKRQSNLRRHGLDFVDSRRIWRSRQFVIIPSDRPGEIRYKLIGMFEEQVVVLVWTPRGGSVRCISFRRADDAEKRQYRVVYL